MKNNRKMLINILVLAVLACLVLAGCGSPTSVQAEPIGLEAAKAVALEDAGLSASAVSFTTTGLDRQGDTEYYAIDFTSGDSSYQYDIDAISGRVIECRINQGTSLAAQPQATQTPQTAQTAQTSPAPGTQSSQTPSAQTQSSGELIGEEAARDAALEHAGLTESQVTFLKTKLDREDGRQVYEVEFYTQDYKEYDYEIDALTGEVRSFDYDVETYFQTSGNSGTGTELTAEEAKALALSQVPGATESDIIEFKTDRDDGRIEYEGEILYSGMKYEFEIDGYSGAIRSWEVEKAHHW